MTTAIEGAHAPSTDILETPSAARSATPASVWAGRVLSGLAVLFLAFDVGIKLVEHPMAIEGTVQLGYPASALLPIALSALACWVLYVVPRTSVLGAVLWTGYLGGAVATHLRLENPLFSHTLFPIYVAAFVWGGLYLREPRVRALLPLRRAS